MMRRVAGSASVPSYVSPLGLGLAVRVWQHLVVWGRRDDLVVALGSGTRLRDHLVVLWGGIGLAAAFEQAPLAESGQLLVAVAQRGVAVLLLARLEPRVGDEARVVVGAWGSAVASQEQDGGGDECEEDEGDGDGDCGGAIAARGRWRPR